MKKYILAGAAAAMMAFPMMADALTITTRGGAVVNGTVGINSSSLFSMNIEGDAIDGAGSTWFGFTASEALTALETNSLNPINSFVGARVEWNSASDGTGISFGSITGAALTAGDVLRTTFTAGETKFLIASWTNVARDQSDFDLRVEATVVPVPATLGLLLTGLAGMGVMARRRRNASKV
jgi:hypothetical protein